MISNDNLILSNNIKNLSVIVTDEISPKYLKEFIQTSIEIENLTLNLQSKVFVSFISEINSYEIYLFDSLVKSPLNIYQIFSIYYSNNQNLSIDLFITKDFFVVYKNGLFYFAKENEEYSNNDILNYISFTYKLKIDNIYNIDDKKIKELEENLLVNNLSSLEYMTFEKSNSYSYFLIYIFLLIFCSSYLFYIKSDKKIDNNMVSNIKQLQIYKSKYKNLLEQNMDNRRVIKDLIEFFNYLKVYKIYLIKMEYKNNIKAIIVANSKEQLYDFLAVYDKKSKVINIKKDEKMGNYIMEIQVEI
ncbi:MAG: hypothetical protein KAJ49_07655 [Arcobacteraceae bacterium]|nr:hypothetical protein [Arcobacteraceae bacterium]